MRLRSKYTVYAKFLIYLVIVVLINVVAAGFFFRLDLTADNIYSISDASKKTVSTLSEPLTIKVFFTKNLPAPHNNTERYLHDLLEEYALFANRNFNYRFYNVSPSTEGVGGTTQANQQQAADYGIHPVQIQAVEKDEVKFIKAYMGLVLIHGDLIERITTITSIDGLEYRLTTAIHKLNNKVSAFLNLEQKIRIKLVLSSSLFQVAPLMGISALETLPRDLAPIIEKLNQKTYGNIDYAHIDPSRPEGAQTDAAKYNLLELKWPNLPQDNIKAGHGTIGLIMQYGEKVQTERLLNVIELPIVGTQYSLVDVQELEEIISKHLETLIAINEDIGYLADHGTLPLGGRTMAGGQGPEGLSSFSNLVSQTYNLQLVYLKKEAIPESLGSLIIARPTEPFSDYALYQIDQALMRGTRLAVFTDAFAPAPPNASQGFGQNMGTPSTPLDTGLNKLLNHWGVRINPAYVLDPNSHRQPVPAYMGGGEQAVYFAPIIKNENINHKPAFMKNIKSLVTFKISPLIIDEKRIEKQQINAIRLFSSSAESWELQNPPATLNPFFIREPAADAKRQSFDLAYVLEGAFSSYFSVDTIPVREAEAPDAGDNSTETPADTIKAPTGLKQEGMFLAKGKPAKILIAGSSEFLKNRILGTDSQNSNALFILNALDALNGREDMAVMRAKVNRFNPLYEMTAPVRTIIKTIHIAGLPILVVFFGLFVWMRRAGRKKQIQMMFTQ